MVGSVRCPQCGRTCAETRASCADCGAALAPSCERCGLALAPGARFCAQCGPPPALRAERKYVTVLFADIEDSTALVAGVDPEEAAERIEPALAAMRAAVHRHQGTVNRVIGDGIMALFGAPLAQEQHATAACFAALDMLAEVGEQTQPRLRIRVGLHSGEVLLRGIANDLSVDYDAIGEVPHVARRMEERAAAGEACASALTFRLAQRHVEGRSLGPVALRGLAAPLEVYALLGRRAQRSAWFASAQQELSELVGREAELAQLLAELERARQGSPRIAQLCGEPGIGKSRLGRELVRRARARGWQVAIGAAYPGDALDPYAALSRLLRSWLRAEDRERQSEVRARLERALHALLPGEADEYAAPLESLLDLPVREPRWEQLHPARRRARIVAALAGFANAAAAQRPLVLVIEDLHWADDETLATFEAQLAALRGPLLVLLSYRPERPPQWSGAQGLRLALRPLGAHGGRRLLDALLGPHAALVPLKRELLERSGGNPLFLEESVRSLAESGALLGEPGAFRCEQRVELRGIPAQLHALIAARVDRLAPALRGRLQTAAVIGREFSVAVLVELEQCSAESLREELGALAQLGFLESAAQCPEGPYRFRHALMQQVVYEGLARGTRRAGHARVLRILERVHGDRLAEHVGELAEHALRGQLWEAAAEYRLRACIGAHQQSASREVLAILDRALATFAQMPEDPAVLRRAVDLRLLIANAAVALGEHRRLAPLLEEARALAERCGDGRRLASVYNESSLALWMSGEYGPALAASAQAAALAREHGHASSALGSRFLAGVAHHALGDYPAAIAAHLEVLAGLRGELEHTRSGYAGHPAVLARGYLIDAYLQLGEHGAAGAHAEYGSALADRLGHVFSQAMLRISAALWMLAEGRCADAIELLEKTLERVRSHEHWTMDDMVCARLAQAYLQAGRAAAAQSAIEPLLRSRAYRRGGRWAWVELLRVGAQARHAGGDAEGAAELAREAEALARKSGAHGQLAHVLALQARLAPAQPARSARRARELASELEEALALARALGMQPLLRELQGYEPLA